LREKVGNEPKQRWFASDATLIELNLKDSEELTQISRNRLEEMVKEMALE